MGDNYWMPSENGFDVECPHCGDAIEDLDSFFSGGTEIASGECPACAKPIRLRCATVIEYSIEVPG